MSDLISCNRCLRLADFRGNMAAAPATHRDCAGEYWSKPVPGFGDLNAEVLIVGLAPGFHGANRTGRPFTGDYAGDFIPAYTRWVLPISRIQFHVMTPSLYEISTLPIP